MDRYTRLLAAAQYPEVMAGGAIWPILGSKSYSSRGHSYSWSRLVISLHGAHESPRFSAGRLHLVQRFLSYTPYKNED